MTLKTKWIEILYNLATSSRKNRNFFTRERRKAPCFSNGDIRRLPQSNSSL